MLCVYLPQYQSLKHVLFFMILTAAGINYIMKGLLPEMIQVKEKAAHDKPVVYQLQNNESKHSPIEHTVN